MIEIDEVADHLRRDRMALLRKHEVVGGTNRFRLGEDNWVCESWHTRMERVGQA